MTHNTPPADYYDQSLDNPIQWYWHRKRFRQVINIIKPLHGSLLDVGCDGATFTERMKASNPNLNVVAVDVSKTFIRYSVEKCPDVPFVVSDGQRLPFKEETFEVLSCLEVLEHVVDPTAVLKEAHRCLKKGGECIILVPNGKSRLFRIIWFFWLKGKGKSWRDAHKHDFREDDIEKQLVTLGFTANKKVKFHFGMLLLTSLYKDDEGVKR